MKNKILLTAIVLLVLNWLNVFSQNFPNVVEFDIQSSKQLKLKSNVKSIATSKYKLEIEFNNIKTGDFQSKTSLLFNTGGLIKKNLNESLNENLSSDYFYNSAGLLFKIKHSSGEIIVNKYNENNEISEQYSYDNEGKLIYLIKNIFNVQGTKIETLKLNGYDSEIEEKTIYKYSSRGNLISSEKSIFSEISKKILKKIISNFNQQGLIVELINDNFDPTLGGDVILKTKEAYKYDSIGNMIQYVVTELYSNYIVNLNYKVAMARKYYRYIDLPTDIKSKYEKYAKWRVKFKQNYKFKNNILSAQGYDSNYGIEFTYNSKGDLVEVTNKLKNEKTLIIYTYDSNDNWTSKIQYNTNFSSGIILESYENFMEEREIEYWGNMTSNIVSIIDDCVTENEVEIFIDESPYKLGDKIKLELGTHLFSSSLTYEDGIFDRSEIEFKVVEEDKEIIVNSCEGSACPYFYYVSNGNYIYGGELIRNINSKVKETIDSSNLFEKFLKSDTLRIRIKEEKSEVSYLDQVYLIINDSIILLPVLSKNMNNNLLSKRDSNYLVMKNGDSHEVFFILPEFIKNKTGKIISYGYYEPVGGKIK